MEELQDKLSGLYLKPLMNHGRERQRIAASAIGDYTMKADSRSR